MLFRQKYIYFFSKFLKEKEKYYKILKFLGQNNYIHYKMGLISFKFYIQNKLSWKKHQVGNMVKYDIHIWKFNRTITYKCSNTHLTCNFNIFFSFIKQLN